MTEMFLQISVSLDGYIEDPNGDADDGVRRQLTLTRSESFSSGATLQRYRFA